MNAERERHPTATPQQVYAYLLAFWKMHLTVEDPDLTQLRDLHRALCNQEAQISAHALDLCLQNLLERLQQARDLGLQLSIPDWAMVAIENFTEQTDEAQP